MADKIWFFITIGDSSNRPIINAIRSNGLRKSGRACIFNVASPKGGALAHELKLRGTPAVFVGGQVAYGPRNVLAVIQNIVKTRMTIDQRLHRYNQGILDKGDDDGRASDAPPTKKDMRARMAEMAEARRLRFEKSQSRVGKKKPALGKPMKFGESFSMPAKQEQKLALGDENSVRDYFRAEAKRAPDMSKFA